MSEREGRGESRVCSCIHIGLRTKTKKEVKWFAMNSRIRFACASVYDVTTRKLLLGSLPRKFRVAC